MTQVKQHMQAHPNPLIPLQLIDIATDNGSVRITRLQAKSAANSMRPMIPANQLMPRLRIMLFTWQLQSTHSHQKQRNQQKRRNLLIKSDWAQHCLPTCTLSVSDADTIWCCSCMTWFHVPCVGVSPAHMGTYWTCLQCRTSARLDIACSGIEEMHERC